MSDAAISTNQVSVTHVYGNQNVAPSRDNKCPTLLLLQVNGSVSTTIVTQH